MLLQVRFFLNLEFVVSHMHLLHAERERKHQALHCIECTNECEKKVFA